MAKLYGETKTHVRAKLAMEYVRTYVRTCVLACSLASVLVARATTGSPFHVQTHVHVRMYNCTCTRKFTCIRTYAPSWHHMEPTRSLEARLASKAVPLRKRYTSRCPRAPNNTCTRNSCKTLAHHSSVGEITRNSPSSAGLVVYVPYVRTCVRKPC